MQSNSKYIIPNLITALNMFLGFTAINIAIDGNFTNTIWIIWAAGFLDMLDGRLARAMNASTQFGIEFDSLSDLVAFGIAPSMLLHQAFFVDWDFPGIAIAFLPALFGALRLARYNVEWGTKEKGFMKGVPIPVSALILSSYVAFADKVWGDYKHPELAALLIIVVSGLMVSTLRFESHNKANVGKAYNNGKFFVFIFGCLTILVFGLYVMFMWGVFYVAFALGRWGLSHRPGHNTASMPT